MGDNPYPHGPSYPIFPASTKDQPNTFTVGTGLEPVVSPRAVTASTDIIVSTYLHNSTGHATPMRTFRRGKYPTSSLSGTAPQTYKGQSQSDSGSVGQARALFAQTAVVSVRSALFQLRYARLLRNAIQIQAQHAYKLLPTKVAK